MREAREERAVAADLVVDADASERAVDDRLAARRHRHPEILLQAVEARDGRPARAGEMDRVRLRRIAAESPRDVGGCVVRQLRHLDRPRDPQAARRDDLEAGLAEVRRELLREARGVRRADRDALRADGLQRLDLAAHERDDRHADEPLRPLDEDALEAVALVRHGGRPAEDDDVDLLVREVGDRGLVALVHAVELRGAQLLQVERGRHDDDPRRCGAVVLVHQRVAARRMDHADARATARPGAFPRAVQGQWDPPTGRKGRTIIPFAAEAPSAATLVSSAMDRGGAVKDTPETKTEY